MVLKDERDKGNRSEPNRLLQPGVNRVFDSQQRSHEFRQAMKYEFKNEVFFGSSGCSLRICRVNCASLLLSHGSVVIRTAQLLQRFASAGREI